MKLYVIPSCPFGHRAAFAAAAKGLPYELVLFDRTKRPAELEALGPRAKSPTLIDGETAVHDSLVVLEYLEDRYRDTPLLPVTPTARAETRMLVTRIAEELVPVFGAVIAEALFAKPRNEERLAEKRQAFLDALAPWDRHLDGRTHVATEQFTIADITLFTMFPAIRAAAGVEIPAERPHLRAWFERTSARPGATPPGV